MPLDIKTVMNACEEDDDLGFCVACGEEHSGIEPDARNYECTNCGKMEVFGAEQIIIEGLAEESEDDEIDTMSLDEGETEE